MEHMSMELRHLRYFVAVAEEGHVTRAAERLGMQQPPLSQQIRALERELDVQLFRRLPRGVELTDAGRALLADARAILQQIEHAFATTRRTARGELGRVAIGLGLSLWPESLQRMRMDGVVFRRLGGAAQPRAPLYLASRRGEASAAVRKFLDLVRRSGAA